MTRTVAFNANLFRAGRQMGGTMVHGESQGDDWNRPAEEAAAGTDCGGLSEHSLTNGTGRCRMVHLRTRPVSAALLEEQAQRLETAAAKDEGIALREVLLIVSSGGAACDADGWAVKPARVEALIAMQAMMTAMTEMLPRGAIFHADVLENGRSAAHVVLASRVPGQCRRASTAALALGAAMFRALAAQATQT